MTTATSSSLYLLAQLDLSNAFSQIGGVRFVTGLTMLIHMFFAELFVGFAIAFIIFGILFAITTPAIGIPTLMVFISLAAILFVGSLTRVGVSPILIEMGAPSEEAGTWNDDFEMGKVLLFASTRERRLLRPIREALQRAGATYYIVDRRLEPRAVHQAVLHRSGERSAGESVADRTGSA